MPEGASILEVLLVSAAAVGFVIIYAFEMIRKRDDWPFSGYAMFSHYSPGTVKIRQLYGVLREGGAERRLVEQRYLHPFDRNRVRYVFWLKAGRHDKESIFTEALRDCLDRYEERRKLGLHDGSPLSGLRVYEEEWELVPQARNREQPDRRELVFSHPANIG